MKVYVFLINGRSQGVAYTSLKGLCDEYNLSYSTISKGKRRFWHRDSIAEIMEFNVKKVKGNFKNNNNVSE